MSETECSHKFTITQTPEELTISTSELPGFSVASMTGGPDYENKRLRVKCLLCHEESMKRLDEICFLCLKELIGVDIELYKKLGIYDDYNYVHVPLQCSNGCKYIFIASEHCPGF